MTSSKNQFLSLRPKWNQQWEKSSGDLVVVLIPKFGNHFAGKWLLSKMAKPNYRLKLDEIGSFVWQRCDGSKSVKEIGDRLVEKFGPEVEPVDEKLNLFFHSLQKSKSITWG